MFVMPLCNCVCVCVCGGGQRTCAQGPSGGLDVQGRLEMRHATLLLAVQDGHLKQLQTGQGLHITSDWIQLHFFGQGIHSLVKGWKGQTQVMKRHACQRLSRWQGQARRLGAPAKTAPNNRTVWESAEAKRGGESSRGWKKSWGVSLPTLAHWTSDSRGLLGLLFPVYNLSAG